LTSPNGGLTERNQIKHLSGKSATRANIIKALNETARQAFDTDFILFFIACHGQPDGEGKEVYFLPYDTEAENLEGTAISEGEVMRIFNRSKAQKKILIADACHSGSLGNVIGSRASAEDLAITNRLLRQIAATDESAAVFAASSANEKSQETPILGNGQGVFTYFLVEGLKGAGDKDNNGLITLREAYEYTYRKVSEFTKGKQHPELKGKFVDYLPLGVVKK
jgi:uncharacterized caspase-like protein